MYNEIFSISENGSFISVDAHSKERSKKQLTFGWFLFTHRRKIISYTSY